MGILENYNTNNHDHVYNKIPMTNNQVVHKIKNIQQWCLYVLGMTDPTIDIGLSYFECKQCWSCPNKNACK